MWTSNEFQLTKQKFNFRAAGMGIYHFTNWMVDDIKVVNQIENLEWDDEYEYFLQMILCACCGFSNCDGGNWLVWRQNNGFVFAIPCFDLWREYEGAYAPPSWISSKGSLWFSPSDFTLVQNTISFFKQTPNFSPMSLVTLMVWEQPCQLLIWMEMVVMIYG